MKNVTGGNDTDTDCASTNGGEAGRGNEDEESSGAGAVDKGSDQEGENEDVAETEYRGEKFADAGFAENEEDVGTNVGESCEAVVDTDSPVMIETTRESRRLY
jgi:hypothetical protein